jgi:acyl-CoA synthetase (NDP forming)
MKSIVNTLVAPRSVAIVGVSRSPGKVGFQLAKNLIEDGFRGELYLVNPSAKSILNHPCYPTLTAIGKAPDLVIITTPRQIVPVIIEESSRLGCQVATIITAGFAELDHLGNKLQDQITINKKSLRVLGPNCLGTLSPVNHLNVSFGPRLGKVGSIMVISQSGAMITGVLDWANFHDIGISHAISLGNRIDISELDCLRFAAADSATKHIIVYLESFSNTREFFALASTITPQKPIILLKGGVSQSGKSASASHTASLATDQVLVSELARQTGVILASDMHSWLNTAALFGKIGDIKGKDVCIVTNAGGPGVVAADEAEERHLQITPLDKKSYASLKRAFAEIDIQNPLDLRGDAGPETFATALSILCKDAREDSILVIITPQTTTRPDIAAKRIAAIAKTSPKPVITVLIGGQKLESAKSILNKANIPVYDYPSQALSIVAAKADYDTRKQSIPVFPRPAVSHPNKPMKPELLTIDSGFKLLAKYGLTVSSYRVTQKITDIPAITKKLGWPLYAKTASMGIAHKALSGGVIGPIMTNVQARLAFRQLTSIFPSVLFQKSIHGIEEGFIGCKRDASAGPFIVTGLGGSKTDMLADRHYTFIPAAKISLKDSVKRSKLYQIITNDRLERFVEHLQKLEQLCIDHPEISELELNPIIITVADFVVVDLKIILNPD